MASLLLDEEFVAVFPSLVRRLGGMNRAAVLQSIHFAAQIRGQQRDRRIWTLMTARQIADRTGLSEDACQRALTSLVDAGVLISRAAGDGTRKLLWSIEYERLGASRDSAETPDAISRSPHRDSAESSNTKNIKNKPNKSLCDAENDPRAVVDAYVHKFKATLDVDPESQSVGRITRDARRMLEEGRPLELLIASAENCVLRGHANLSASVTALLTLRGRKPRGFDGIRAFLESDDQS